MSQLDRPRACDQMVTRSCSPVGVLGAGGYLYASRFCLLSTGCLGQLSCDRSDSREIQ